MTPEEVLEALDDAPAAKPAEMVRFEKKPGPTAIAEPEAPRFSQRSWSKGSARGEGPQKKHGAVVVRRGPVKLDETPMDHMGRKLERCVCGEWAPKPPYYCQCMEKCPTCKRWFSTKATPHQCVERDAVGEP